MEQIIKKVLKKIENNGYEAYLVGGYVRDFILSRKTYDIDICTNALPKELNNIFPGCQNNCYGGITFKIKKFNFDITTYRKEKKYESRHPVEIEYINNLFEDINRRDFKINAICMNGKGFVIDLMDGISDINNKTISVIGDCAKKFEEDPLRMLRAIRFATILDFRLDDDIELQIKKQNRLILNLSNNRIKEELDKILTNKNAIKGLQLLDNLGVLEVLNISYKDIVYINDLVGMWAQLNMELNSAFTKEEKNNIMKIRDILKLKSINKFVVFEYGLYLSLVAGVILGINRAQINKIYKQMPIHNKQEIKVSANDIMEILNIQPSEVLSIIINDVTEGILSKKIKNNYNEIKKYLLLKKATWIK